MMHLAVRSQPRKGRYLGGVVFCLASLAVCCLANEPTPSAALPLAETTSLLPAIGKVFGSLLVVVGLMLLILYGIKRAGIGAAGSRGGSSIAVLETRMVAPKRYIAIVEIADRCLAIGITEHNINLLADLGLEVKAALASQSGAVKPGSAFAALLQKSMRSWQGAAPDSKGQAMNSNQERPESP